MDDRERRRRQEQDNLACVVGCAVTAAWIYVLAYVLLKVFAGR